MVVKINMLFLTKSFTPPENHVVPRYSIISQKALKITKGCQMLTMKGTIYFKNVSVIEGFCEGG